MCSILVMIIHSFNAYNVGKFLAYLEDYETSTVPQQKYGPMVCISQW